MDAFLEAVPLLNTVIVAVVGILLIAGYGLIRAGHVTAHKRVMLTATGLFALFLVLYATRLVLEGPTEFTRQNPDAPGWAAPFYYTFLGTHMVLALVTVVIIPIVVRRALRGEFARHKRLARKLLPMWLVSIAMGISVYFMLFEIWR